MTKFSQSRMTLTARNELKMSGKLKGPSEDDLQKMCVKWFKLQYPDVLMFHVPNGGSRHIAEATKLKAMGVLPGVPDIMILEPKRTHDWQHGRVNSLIKIPGLAIELKVPGGKISAHQGRVQDKLKDANWEVQVCWSFDEFKNTVEAYFSK